MFRDGAGDGDWRKGVAGGMRVVGRGVHAGGASGAHGRAVRLCGAAFTRCAGLRGELARKVGEGVLVLRGTVVEGTVSSDEARRSIHVGHVLNFTTERATGAR